MFIETCLTPAVADFLDKYFTNFDREGFSLSWSGYANLNDLRFRTDAIDKFLPVKCLGGKVGSLGITATVGLFPGLSSTPKLELTLKDVYIILAPPTELAYNQAEESQSILEAKRLELVSLENKRNSAGSPEEIKGTGISAFFEQILATAINNITVTIENIHIRFEDNRSATPFSFGFTLKSLTLQSTDANWVLAETISAAKTSFKLLKLSELGLYLNPGESNPLIKNPNDRAPDTLNRILDSMKDLLGNPTDRLSYVLENMDMTVKGKITLQPEKLDNKFSLPKIDLDVELPQLSIAVVSTQFKAAVEFEDKLEAMQRSKRYLWCRPAGVPYKGQEKIWWKFAYQAVLMDVRRTRENWNWNHIKNHRALCKEYAAAYAKFISQDNPSEADKAKIQALEDKLDNFNIILIRKQQDILNTRMKKKIEQKSKSLWFGTATLTKEDLDEIMTGKFSDEEKAKLYSAIEYEPSQESIPTTYTDFRVKFALPSLRIVATNMKAEPEQPVHPVKCLDISMKGLQFGHETYPANNGVKNVFSFADVNVTGVESESMEIIAPPTITPSATRGAGDPNTAPGANSPPAPTKACPPILLSCREKRILPQLFAVEFEKHDLDDDRSSKRVKVTGEKLTITFDTKTYKELSECFGRPSDVKKNWTSDLVTGVAGLGLNYASATLKDWTTFKNDLEMDVNYALPDIELHENGDAATQSCHSILIVSLGTYTASSKVQKGADPKTIQGIANSVGNITPALNELVYNHYDITIKDFEIKMKDSKVKWLLKTGLSTVAMKQCILRDVQRFTLQTVDISYSLLEIDISDQDFLKMVGIFSANIPYYGWGSRSSDVSDDPVETYQMDVRQLVSPSKSNRPIMSLIGPTEAAENKTIDDATKDDNFDPETAPQFTIMYICFHAAEFKMKLSKTNDRNKHQVDPVLLINVTNFRLASYFKTFGMSLHCSVEGGSAIYADKHIIRNEPIYLFKTYATDGSGDPAFVLDLFAVNSACPVKEAGIVRRKISFQISSVDSELFEDTLVWVLKTLQSAAKILRSNQDEVDQLESKLEAFKAKHKQVVLPINHSQNDVNIKLVTNLSSFKVKFSANNRYLLQLILDKYYGNLEDGPSQTKIVMKLQDLKVLNLDTPTIYPKVVGLKNPGEKLIDADICIYKKERPGELDPDMEFKVTFAAVTVVVIGSVVDNILQFASKFRFLTKALANASKLLVKKTASLVKDAGKNDAKTLLNIKFNAPILCLPKDTESSECMVHRCGLLQITNSLQIKPTESGRNAIIDEIAIKFDGVGISSSYIAPDGSQEIQSELTIMESVLFDVTLTRNLSTAWYQGLPLADLRVVIEPVVVKLSFDDILFELQCLLALRQAVIRYPIFESDSKEEIEVVGSPAQDEETEGPPPPYLCILSLHLDIKEVNGSLYIKNPSLFHAPRIVERTDEYKFAFLVIKNNPISLKWWNNKDISFGMNAEDIKFEDARPNQAEVTKFLEQRHLPADDKSRPIYEIEFERKKLPSGGYYYKFLMYMASEELTLSISFLGSFLKLVKDISESLPRAPKSAQALNPKRSKIYKDSVQGDIPPPVFDCTVLIPGMDIVILEDATSKDTNSLLLNFDTKVDVNSNGGESHGRGYFNIGLSTAKKVPGIPIKPFAQIWSPTTINATLDITPGNGVVFEVNVSHMTLHISTGTVLIFSKIMNAINNLPRPGEAEGELPDYSEAWESTENRHRSYWFLKSKDLKADADNLVRKEEVGSIEGRYRDVRIREKFTISQLQFDSSFEVGTGVISTPLGLVNSTIDIVLTNWSTNLQLTADVKFSACYNDTYFGVWEYLMEPIEIPKPFGDPPKKWWEAHFDIMNPQGTPNVKVNVTCHEIMELTFSKTALIILKKLIDSYATAAFDDVSEKDVKTPPYVFKNDTGFPLILDIENTPFLQESGDLGQSTIINLETGTEVDLGLRAEVGIGQAKTQLQRTIKVTIPELEFSESIIIANAKPRYFELTKTSYNGQKYGLLFDIVTNSGSSTLVTARSIVEVTNFLRVPVEVHNATRKGTVLLTTLQPNSKWALPLSVVHERSDGICFKAQGYQLGAVPFSWQNLRTQKSCVWSTTASPESNVGDSANIKIIGQGMPAVIGNSDTPTPLGENYKIYLKGHLVINNLLPIDLTFQSHGNTVLHINPGKSANIFSATPVKQNVYEFDLKVSNYRGTNWTAKIVVEENKDDLVPAVFTSDDGSQQTVCFGYQKIYENDMVTLNVYCPYWMVNYSGKTLSYKSSSTPEITVHDANSEGLLMYAYDTVLTGEKTVLQCEDSEWSKEINLNAAGIKGVVVCKAKDQDYPLTTDIILSKCNLSKIIKFTPRNTIVNTCPYPINFYESDKLDDPILVPKHSSTPFWPKGTSGKFRVQVKDTEELSLDLYYDRANDSFVKLENKYGGIHAVVQANDTNMTIILSEFMSGEAPILIVNDTLDIQLTYSQFGTKEDPEFLDSGESILYTWFDPTAENRSIAWGPGGYKETVRCTLDLDTDARGDFTASNNNNYKWISVRSGVQRILIVTTNVDLIDSLDKISKPTDELPLLEVSIQASGIGISVVDNEHQLDVLYIRTGSVDPVWEGGPLGQTHFRLLDQEQNMILEHGYQAYRAGQIEGKPAILAGDIHVDFETCKMIAPSEQQLLRHPYKPGVAIKFKKYSQMMEVSLKLGTLQVDNQLSTAVNPRVFTIAPLERTVTLETEVHPEVLTLTLSKRTTPASNVNFICGEIILQEFNVTADMSLLDALTKILGSNDQEVAEKLGSQYKKDLAMAGLSRADYNQQIVDESTAGRTILVFQKLEVYKLKFNLTFDLRGGDGSTRNPLLIFTQGIGAAFGNISDKPFVVNGLTISNTRLTMSQLLSQVINHYVYGIITNLYTIVFELDIIGNPFKLITGLGSGIGSLLTEPFQGAMQGHLLEGVTSGVGSLVDSTLGNVAESVSRITGSFAKGADALGLHILGGAVGGFSSFFGGIKKITHGTEKTTPAVRPPRLFIPNSFLEPYSPTKVRGIYLLKQANYPDTGPLETHVFVAGDKVMLLASKMGIYIQVYPDDINTMSSVLWAHNWNEFADISSKDSKTIDYDLKDAGGFLFVRNNPHLNVEVLDPETYGYVLTKSNELLKTTQ